MGVIIDLLIEKLTYQLQLSRHLKFARKSEKDNPSQFGLFDEASLSEDENIEPIKEECVLVKEHVRVRKGRKPLPKNLPRHEIIHDLPETEKTCGCGFELSCIGEEKSEQLELIPQLAYVVVNIKKKYACKKCEETIKTAKLPTQPIPSSIATAGTLAYVIDSKFNYHLPLYRLEQILNRNSVEITRATLGTWIIKASHLLLPLVKLLHDNILHYDIAYADESVVQVLNERGRDPTSKSRMWLFAGGPPSKRAFIYQYHPTRSGDVATQFFDGFHGYLHVDCYSGYNALFKTQKVKAVGCWVHARRYFYNIAKLSKKKKGLAHFAVDHIAKLYQIETQARLDKLTPHEIHAVRREKSLPLLTEFKTWLDEHALKIPDQSPISVAIHYCLRNWEKLMGYVMDGRLEIDNNRSERAIKPFVIGRKNWLFCGNEEGANAAAIIYSLMETCKEHQIEPYAYFKYVLKTIVSCDTVEHLEKLLPYYCDRNELAKQRELPELIWPVKGVGN